VLLLTDHFSGPGSAIGRCMCLCVRTISLTLERNNFDVDIRSGGSTGSSCGQGQVKVQGHERKTLLKWPVRSQVRAFLGGIAIRVKIFFGTSMAR